MNIAQSWALAAGGSLLLIWGTGTLAVGAVLPEPAQTPKASFRVNALPLVFHPNIGQDNPEIRFTSRGFGYSLLFTQQETIFVLDKDAKHSGALRMKVAHARPDAAISGVEELSGKVNYLIGNDPAKWHKGIPLYRQVAYEGVLPGVDLLYYGRDRSLEYDFRVAPGTDPRNIEMILEGGDWSARIAAEGILEINSKDGSVQFTRPIAYQIATDGSRQPVAARYVVDDGKRFGFRLGRYDHSRELVIDPTLVYSTYYGGSRDDYGNKIALDSQGNTYIVGSTSSNDLPGTGGGYQPNRLAPIGGYGTYQNYTAFFAKFDSNAQLIYATYLGGSASERGNGIAVDSGGNVIIVGYTNSTDFPLQNAAQSTCGPAASSNNFTCAYNTYSNCASLGGGNGSVPDAFITKLDPTGTQLIYSTYLGGTDWDIANSVTVNAAGEAFVTGQTNSIADTHAGCPANGPYCGNNPPDLFAFPTSANAYMQPPVVGGCPSYPYHTATAYTWLARLSATGVLEYSTYFGPPPPDEPGSGQTIANGIALDASDNVYVAGQTQDTGFPSIPGAVVQCGAVSCNNGHWNAWTAKFDLAGSSSSQLVYSTLFGGSSDDVGNSLAIDAQGNAYVAGNTNSSDFPVTSDSLVTQYGGNGAGFVTKVNAQGNNLAYSTYLTGQGESAVIANGIAVDSTGAAAVVGQVGGGGFTFPLTNPVQSNLGNSPDGGYLVRLTPDGTGTLFATYFGYFSTAVNGITLDNFANAYITGDSTNAPTTTGESCPDLNQCGSGSPDAFVAKIDMCSANGFDMSSQFTVSRGGMRYVAASKLFLQTVTITNSSGAAVNGPIDLVLTALSSDAALANETGATTCVSPGSPYLKVLASGSLGAGQSIVTQLQFNDPTKAGITYSTSVIVGAGAP